MHVLLRRERAGALNDMQLQRRADAEPGVAAIVEGVRDFLEAQHSGVEIGAGFQVAHAEGGVVEGKGRGGGRLCARGGEAGEEE